MSSQQPRYAGSEFHVIWAATVKIQRPSVVKRWDVYWWRAAERKCCLEAIEEKHGRWDSGVYYHAELIWHVQPVKLNVEKLKGQHSCDFIRVLAKAALHYSRCGTLRMHERASFVQRDPDEHCATFGHSKSNRSSVMKICQKILTPHAQPFKVSRSSEPTRNRSSASSY